MASRRSTVAVAAVGLIFHFLLNLISFNGIFCYAACALYYKLLKNLPKIWFERVFSLKNHIFPWYRKINDFCNFGFISEKGPWDYLDIFSGIHRKLRTFSESKVRLRFTNTNTISMRLFFKPWSIENSILIVNYLLQNMDTYIIFTM